MKKFGGASSKGIVCPPPVGMGLTDLPNIGRGDRGTPSPHPTPVPVSLTLSMCAFGAFLDWVFGSIGILKLFQIKLIDVRRFCCSCIFTRYIFISNFMVIL